MNKETTIKVMNDFFDHFKSNPNHLANIVGMRPQSIYDVVDIKKQNVGISKRFAKKIADNFPVNESYFLTGSGSMLKSEIPASDDVVQMSREVFEQISRLTETVLSQQRTIENLTADNKKTDTAGSA